MKAIEGETIGVTWLAAAEYLSACRGRSEFNLVVEVARPAERNAADREIIKRLDGMLRKYNRNPVSTVAETIFPFALYRNRGVDGVFCYYHEVVYPAIAKLDEISWGTYAHRFVRWPTSDGGYVNQLEVILNKLKGGSAFKAVYELAPGAPKDYVSCEPDGELTSYWPDRDAARNRGRQCLSHVSIKVRNGSELIVTALYRYHFYIEKALGNLVGLSYLQGFLCNESGLSPGPLVCVSTYATLDTGSGDSAWGVAATEELLRNARADVEAQGATDELR